MSLKLQLEVSNVTPSQDIVVKNLLLSLGNRDGLFDNTHESNVVDTIVSLSEKQRGFGLGARRVEENIIVDFNLLKGQKEQFDQIYNEIYEKLGQLFENQVKALDPASFVRLTRVAGQGMRP